MKKDLDPISRDVIRVKFEGSLFGDQEIERLTFIAEFKDDTLKRVYLHPSDEDEYWETLNQKKYLKEAKKFVTLALKENETLAQAIENGYFQYL